MEIPGYQHIYSGKVRELFKPLDPNFSHLALIVATDRISAFDHILSPEIPGKGIELTKITNWWFDQIDFPNHRSDELKPPAEIAQRAVVVKNLEMYGRVRCSWLHLWLWLEGIPAIWNHLRNTAASWFAIWGSPARTNFHPRLQSAARRKR